MINWTEDERALALLQQARAHFNEYYELSLEVEAKLDLIREEYLNDLWRDFRGECFDDFGRVGKLWFFNERTKCERQ